jgi:hypothetical protein
MQEADSLVPWQGKANMNATRAWQLIAVAGLGLGLAASTGCQTNVAGMTLPSGHYLQHPPQYFAPSPAFPLQRELAAMEAPAGGAAAVGAPGAPAPEAPGAAAAPGAAGAAPSAEGTTQQTSATQASAAQTSTSQTDQFAQAPEAGTEAAETAAPQMMGDFGAYKALVNCGTSGVGGLGGGGLGVLGGGGGLPSGFCRIPLVTRGAFKIADNESPLPQSRIFVNYNYFNGVHSDIPDFNVHRETIGFEQTFCDCAGSIGLRLPIIETPGFATQRSTQTTTNGFGFTPFIPTPNTGTTTTTTTMASMLNLSGFKQEGVGDLSVVLKYVVLGETCDGNGISTGLLITTPTGRDITTVDGVIHDTLLQPYVGYLWTPDNWFVEGFTAVVIPTDDRDVTLLFTDLGVGYRLCSTNAQQLFTSFAPVLEGHFTRPLDHRGIADPITVPTLFVMTTGLHIGLGKASLLSLGLDIPLTGPNPYDLEFVTQLNLRY